MLLGHNMIKTIEGLLETGHTLELRVVGEQVTVEKRPDSDDLIPIHPTLADAAGPVELILSKDGQLVRLAVVIVPAGFVISGIKGHQGISREIP